MQALFYKFGKNIKELFRGRNLLYQLLAVVLTYLIVVSGFDWKYFQFFRGGRIANIMFSAAVVGGFFPLLVPAILLLVGKIRKNAKLLNVGFALGQAAIIGSFLSSFYKMLTGRAHPDAMHTLTTLADKIHNIPAPIFNDVNVTHVFKFGLFQGGIFWGWPSSHTTIAFAMAFTLWGLYSKNKILKALALLYALYIGFGVSITIHWFSDFVAGAIFGILIGVIVGKRFKK